MTAKNRLILIALISLIIGTTIAIGKTISDVTPQPIQLEHVEAQGMAVDAAPSVDVGNVPVDAAAGPEIPNTIDIVESNPNGCNRDTQWIWSDGSCHNKDVDVQPVGDVNAVAPASDASRQEIIDYICTKGWDCNYAIAVFNCESGLNPYAKGDQYVIGGIYAPSIGITQIRLLPGRPSEDQLYDWRFNIDYAYGMWVNSGWKPWSCSAKV